jgi:small conductance mechanosensitive channel
MTGITEQFVLDLVFWVLVPAIAGPLIARWAGRRATRAGRSPARVRGIEVIVTIAWVSVLAAGLTVTLGGVSFVSTLTFSAIAGIAVTLALQTTLQNLVSGMILLQNRVLRVGDAVQFSGIKGRIAGIGPITTVIKLEDGTLAFVSNSNLLSGPLLNTTASGRFAGEY